MNEYFAGLFDGEGSVGVSTLRSKFIRVQISNTHRGILEKLKQEFGGGIYAIKKTKPQYKQVWNWQVTCKQARNFLNSVAPYLIIKKEKTLEVLNR